MESRTLLTSLCTNITGIVDHRVEPFCLICLRHLDDAIQSVKVRQIGKVNALAAKPLPLQDDCPR